MIISFKDIHQIIECQSHQMNHISLQNLNHLKFDQIYPFHQNIFGEDHLVFLLDLPKLTSNFEERFIFYIIFFTYYYYELNLQYNFICLLYLICKEYNVLKGNLK